MCPVLLGLYAMAIVRCTVLTGESQQLAICAVMTIFANVRLTVVLIRYEKRIQLQLAGLYKTLLPHTGLPQTVLGIDCRDRAWQNRHTSWCSLYRPPVSLSRRGHEAFLYGAWWRCVAQGLSGGAYIVPRRVCIQDSRRLVEAYAAKLYPRYLFYVGIFA